MATRQLEIYIPESHKDVVIECLDRRSGTGIWRELMEDGLFHVAFLVPAEESEPILDELEDLLSGVEGFRIVILPVEASIPRPDEDESRKRRAGLISKTPRVSREELYADLIETVRLNWVYILLVVLSTLVAAVGLIRDSVAVIIGAMVIAPLLGPNVGLSLATTLADSSLAKKAFKSLIAGIGLSLILSIVLGFFLKFDPAHIEIASRTKVSFGDIVIALASGSVGALAFTTAIPTMLVGVMVAVALLPPLVVLGLLIGAGYYVEAWGAFLLLFTNLICINLSGVLTFYFQDVRPLTWWDAEKARKATSRAILIWIILLIVLAILVYFSRAG